jgi:hypothetical protein
MKKGSMIVRLSRKNLDFACSVVIKVQRGMV